MVGEKIAAEGGFVEVHPFGKALLAGDFVAGVDAALGADAVAAFDGDHREEIDADALFGQLDGASEASKSAADDDDTFFGYRSHVVVSIFDLKGQSFSVDEGHVMI